MMTNLFNNIKLNKRFVNSELEDVYIPECFESQVLEHIIRNNAIEKASNFSPPLLLGIQGAYGMGKTFMVKEICKRYNIELIQMSASDLSGNVEAASRDKFKKIYSDACILAVKTKQCTAILIDDFHLSIATEDDIGKTVNSNLLSSVIMNICDNPWISNTRVPIVLTGNNFLRIYAALVRAGRMEIITWSPSCDETLRIVKQIFQARFENISYPIIEELVLNYPNNSIAFFTQVAEDILFDFSKKTLELFKTQRGDIKIADLRQSINNHVKNISIESHRVLEIAEIRHGRILRDFESNSSNPNEII